MFVVMTPCCGDWYHFHYLTLYTTIVNRRRTFLGYFCSSKCSSINRNQYLENWSYFECKIALCLDARNSMTQSSYQKFNRWLQLMKITLLIFHSFRKSRDELITVTRNNILFLDEKIKNVDNGVQLTDMHQLSPMMTTQKHIHGFPKHGLYW